MHHHMAYFYIIAFKNNYYDKRENKLLGGEYNLYQLCRETKELCEFCADYGVNYDKFMN